MSMNRKDNSLSNAGKINVQAAAVAETVAAARAVAWSDAEADNTARISRGERCPYCAGTGISAIGVPLPEGHCPDCAGTGRQYAIDLETLQNAVDKRAHWIDPDRKLTGLIGQLFFAVEYMGEAGEGGNVVKKLVRETLEIPGSQATEADLGRELADDIITACNLARLFGIDLNHYVRLKFNETSRARDLPTLI